MVDRRPGYVAISRKLWEDPNFKDSPMSEREAWIWMIAEASWRERRKRVGEVVVDLVRGQFAASLRFLAERFGWNVSKTRRFLKSLEKRHTIETRTGTGVTVITICNYDDYQTAGVEDETPVKQEAAQQRHSSGTNQNQDNQDKDISPFIPLDGDQPEEPKRRSKLPSDFPDQDALDAARKYFGSKGRAYLAERIETEADKFRGWHDGKGTRAKSWRGTWKTWYCNLVSREEANGVPAGRPVGASQPSDQPFDEEAWALEKWKETGEWVSVHLGPPPDHRRCKISPDKLRAAGIEPPTGQMRLAVGL